MLEFLKRKMDPPALPDGTVRKHFWIYGAVQGVGFRYRAKYAADTLHLTGWVENQEDGSVEMELQGQPHQISQVFAMIQKSDYIEIRDVRQKLCPLNPWDRKFEIRG